jgi:predicted transcriptional regulator
VINPYAEYLKIPQEVFKPRRTNAHYIAFIEAVTFYKQYQREKKTDRETGEQYIETTLEDIAEANQLMKEILLRKSDQLSGACRTYFEKLKNHLQEKKQTKFANKEIRQALRENASNQKRYMIQLQEQGYVKKNEGDKKKGFLYEVVSFKEYEQLQSKISNVLDEILSNLKEREVQQFKEVHKGSEPLKAKPGKGKSKKFTEKQDKTKA